MAVSFAQFQGALSPSAFNVLTNPGSLTGLGSRLFSNPAISSTGRALSLPQPALNTAAFSNPLAGFNLPNFAAVGPAQQAPVQNVLQAPVVNAAPAPVLAPDNAPVENAAPQAPRDFFAKDIGKHSLRKMIRKLDHKDIIDISSHSSRDEANSAIRKAMSNPKLRAKAAEFFNISEAELDPNNKPPAPESASNPAPVAQSQPTQSATPQSNQNGNALQAFGGILSMLMTFNFEQNQSPPSSGQAGRFNDVQQPGLQPQFAPSQQAPAFQQLGFQTRTFGQSPFAPAVNGPTLSNGPVFAPFQTGFNGSGVAAPQALPTSFAPFFNGLSPQGQQFDGSFGSNFIDLVGTQPTAGTGFVNSVQALLR